MFKRYRLFIRETIRPLLGDNPHQNALKYKSIAARLYFFGAFTTVYFLAKGFYDAECDAGLTEFGIQDHSPEHKKLRLSGVETSEIIRVDPETKAVTRLQYKREDYLRQLAREALERKKAEQLEILSKGGDLPSEEIKLVEN